MLAFFFAIDQVERIAAAKREASPTQKRIAVGLVLALAAGPVLVLFFSENEAALFQNLARFQTVIQTLVVGMLAYFFGSVMGAPDQGNAVG